MEINDLGERITDLSIIKKNVSILVIMEINDLAIMDAETLEFERCFNPCYNGN